MFVKGEIGSPFSFPHRLPFLSGCLCSGAIGIGIAELASAGSRQSLGDSTASPLVNLVNRDGKKTTNLT